MPLRKNPCPLDHKIYNYGKSSHGHYYYILGLSDSCRERFLKEIQQFKTFYPKIISLGWGGVGGVTIFIIF